LRTGFLLFVWKEIAIVALEPLISLQVVAVSQPDMSTLITSPMVPEIMKFINIKSTATNKIENNSRVGLTNSSSVFLTKCG
jgi:hypothetical protein